jgi:DNA-binding response OmpR family regulator
MKQPPDRPPDLLILDLSRCALDGDEVIGKLRAWPAIPVIVLPGRSGTASDATSGTASGAVARGGVSHDR